MNGSGGKFFARTRVPDQQDSRRSRRHACQLVIQLLHRRRRSQQVTKASCPAQLIAKFADFVFEIRSARLTPKHIRKAFDVDRLGQIISGSHAQRLDSAINRSMSGNHDDLGLRNAIEIAGQFNATAVRQLQVGQQHVRLLARKFGARAPQRIRSGDSKPLRTRDFTQPVSRIAVVVDY